MRLTKSERKQLDRYRDLVLDGQTTIHEQLGEDEPAGIRSEDTSCQPAFVISKDVAEGKIMDNDNSDTLF